MKPASKSRPGLLLLALLLVLTACTYKEVEVGTVESIKIRNLSIRSVGVDLFLPVNNPNSLDLRVSKIHIDLSLNGQYLGTIENDGPVVIMANTEEVYRFGLDIVFESMVRSSVLLLNLVSTGSTELSLDGYITVRVAVLRRKIPVIQQERIQIRS